MSAQTKPTQNTADSSTLPNSSASPAKRTIHAITQSKGGCGKTLVSWILTQYLRDRKRSVVPVDLDTMTHSLALYKGLGVQVVDLLGGPEMTLNGAALDQLASDMLTSKNDFVLDNGASGFIALTRYMVENAFAEMLAEHDAKLMLHVVLAGGPAASQCLMGLIGLLEAFPDVQVLPWVNEHEEPFTVNGKRLEDMPAGQDLFGMMRLKKLSPFALADFKAMRSAEDPLTFEEALGSPKFFLMNRQRLKLIRDGLWAQLDKLSLV